MGHHRGVTFDMKQQTVTHNNLIWNPPENVTWQNCLKNLMVFVVGDTSSFMGVLTLQLKLPPRTVTTKKTIFP